MERWSFLVCLFLGSNKWQIEPGSIGLGESKTTKSPRGLVAASPRSWCSWHGPGSRAPGLVYWCSKLAMEGLPGWCAGQGCGLLGVDMPKLADYAVRFSENSP